MAFIKDNVIIVIALDDWHRAVSIIPRSKAVKSELIYLDNIFLILLLYTEVRVLLKSFIPNKKRRMLDII